MGAIRSPRALQKSELNWPSRCCPSPPAPPRAHEVFPWLLGVQSALAQPETLGPAWTIAYGLFLGPLCCPLFNNQMPPAGLPDANHMLEWLSSFHDIISRYFSVCWVAPLPQPTARFAPKLLLTHSGMSHSRPRLVTWDVIDALNAVSTAPPLPPLLLL